MNSSAPSSALSPLRRLRVAAAVTAGVVAITLAGCGGGGIQLPLGDFRVVNAVSDSTSLDARASGVPSDINNIAVNTASGFRTAPDGSFDLSVTLNTSSGSRPQYSVRNIDIDRDSETTIYLPGRIADSTYLTAPFQVVNSTGAIGTGQFDFRAVHAASDVTTPISIYLTSPDTISLANVTPITLAYRASSTPAQISGGSFRLRVTAQGSATVIFDSGLTGITLAPGSRLQIAAINETDVARGSPIQFLILPSDNSAAITVRNSVAPL